MLCRLDFVHSSGLIVTSKEASRTASALIPHLVAARNHIECKVSHLR